MDTQSHTLPGVSLVASSKDKERRQQGERLKALRRRAGFKDASDAAIAIGVPVPTYRAHENGSRSMIKNATVYADFYGVDFRYLLLGD